MATTHKAKLGEKGVRGMFWRRYEMETEADWVGEVTMMVESDERVEEYPFLGAVPELEEWKHGSRKVTDLPAFLITITNAKYSNAIPFLVDELRRDKTQQINGRIGELAMRVATLPQATIVTDLILGSGNSYDGIAFWGDHSAGPGTRLNNQVSDTAPADAANPTVSELSVSIRKGIDRLAQATDQHGAPISDSMRGVHVLGPAKYRGVLKSAISQQFLTNAESNPLLAQDLSVTGSTTARLTANKIYVARTDAPVKPFIWQDEVRSQLDVLGEGSDYEWHNDAHLYGAKRIGAGAYGEHAMIVEVSLS